MNERDFWTEKTTSGWFHAGQSEAANYVDDTLFVFIHGIFSGPHMWKTWAPEVMAIVGVEADALAYRYTAWPFLRASNRLAAEDLTGALLDRDRDHEVQGQRRYRHLVFVTHSNGGLVLKRWYRTEIDRVLKEKAAHDPVLAGFDAPLALKARLMFMIACPHAGGTWLMSLIAGAVTLVNVLLWPVLFLLNLLTNWFGLVLGLCSIGWTLFRWNPELRDEDNATRGAREGAKQRNWPLPLIVNIKARADVAATNWENDAAFELKEAERGSYPMRGSHVLEGIAPQELKRLSEQLLPNADNLADLSIADHFCALNLARESHLGVDDLCGDREASIQGQQKPVLGALLSWCGGGAKGTHRAVLEGEAGVGKSRVLARLTRLMLVQYLSRCGRHEVRPTVYMNLRDVVLSQPLTENATGEEVLQGILKGWAQACAKAPGLPKRFLERLTNVFSGSSFVLVQDSVDDFLGRNPAVHLEKLRTMWDALEIDPVAGERRVVVGVRSGQPILREFRDGWQRFKLDLLARVEAGRWLPELKDVIESWDDQDVAGLCLRTPLVVFALRRTPEALLELAKAIENGDRRTATILEYALRGIVRSTLPDKSLLTPDAALDALSWLGRISYFKPQRGMAGADSTTRSMTESEMKNGAKEIATLWQDLAENDAALRMRLIAAEGAIVQSESRSLLLRTVFQSLSEGSWEFTHPRWRDLLVARYYAWCVRHEQLESFGGIAYVPNITGLTGQIVGPWTVPFSLVSAAAKRSVEEQDCLYVSNVMAVTAWNPSSILAGKAWNVALEVFCDTKQADFARCLVLNVVAIRWLMGASTANGAAIPEVADGQRAGLIDALTKCVALENQSSELPAHLALTYLHFIAGEAVIGDEPTELNFGTPESFFDRVFLMPDREAPSHSLQHSLIQLVELLPKQAHVRGIATVHYLLMLVLFHRTGRWIEDTRIMLDEAFAEGSFHAKFYRGEIENYQLPAMASRMFNWAKTYWQG